MIEPFFTDTAGVIYCADCFEVLRNLDDASVDMIFTDPPFFISKEIKITRGRNKMKFKGKDISLDFGEWDKQWGSKNEFLTWTFRWVDEAVRLLKPGRLFVSYFDKDKINFLSWYLQEKHQFRLKDYYADILSNPVPQARKVCWMSGWLVIGMWQKPGGKLVFNYQLGQEKNWGIRPIVNVRGRKRHPTEKPLSVAEKFIAYWTNEGDVILDPFCGTGAFLVAAKKLRRRFIGIEINKEFCEIARERLKSCEVNLI